MTPNWQLVTDTRPDTADFPVTAVRSRTRDRAVWAPGVLPIPLSEEHKESLYHFFEAGEIVCAEEWWPRAS